ncbi:MAG TPA: helix-turn-helix domain-containing protein, partial [Kofleriaceae bacterium]
ELVHGTDETAFDRSIDVIVSRLRSKLESDTRHPTLIETVRGVGYRLLSPTRPGLALAQ